ncbi:MAG: hypothetical protein LAO09_20475 [Acidobacteriia bacterium]|nr:hypothetical protein [Terriglobia bacterium]
MRYLSSLKLLAGIVALAFLAGCAKPPASSQVNPWLRIEALPPADPQKITSVRNMKDWKNPYLIVRVDGVALLDASNNEQRILKPDQLVGALAQLPASAWPYGRVVAVAQNAVFGSDADKAQLRRNRAVVAGTLEDLQVLINWVPSA